MQQGKLTIEDSIWNLIRMGNGKELLFVFHDFDQSSAYYTSLEPALGHKFTIIAIDLPGFGLSEWHQKKINKKTLLVLIERLKLEFKAEKINIAGIGFGSLYVMTLLEQRSEWIEKALIIAPLGLKRNSWETAVLFNFLGKRKIKQAIQNPEQLERYMKPLLKWYFLRKEDLPELDRYIRDVSYSELLNKTFPQHYPLVPEIQKVKWNIKKWKTALTIYCDEGKPFQLKNAKTLTQKTNTVNLEKFTREQKMDKSWLMSTIEQHFNPFH
ncbi:MAG TPA: alpha/beta fold hydrolase [Edaphocola sp.]|nr:alpha/beta fold hydrolase [Edaphocola sp.]